MTGPDLDPSDPGDALDLLAEQAAGCEQSARAARTLIAEVARLRAVLGALWRRLPEGELLTDTLRLVATPALGGAPPDALQPADEADIDALVFAVSAALLGEPIDPRSVTTCGVCAEPLLIGMAREAAGTLRCFGCWVPWWRAAGPELAREAADRAAADAAGMPF